MKRSVFASAIGFSAGRFAACLAIAVAGAVAGLLGERLLAAPHVTAAPSSPSRLVGPDEVDVLYRQQKAWMFCLILTSAVAGTLLGAALHRAVRRSRTNVALHRDGSIRGARATPLTVVPTRTQPPAAGAVADPAPGLVGIVAVFGRVPDADRRSARAANAATVEPGQD